jgi:hypothetical protein
MSTESKVVEVPASKAAESFKTLVGGSELEVTLLDGTKETVCIRKLAVKMYPELYRKLTDELGKLAIYLMRSPRAEAPGAEKVWAAATVEFVESLTVDSHEAALLEGEKLNAAFFERWRQRQERDRALLPKQDMGEVLLLMEKLEKQNPELLARVMKQVGATLPSSSPSLSASPG